MDKWAAVILAAGKGTRMKSHLPKVLHPIAGREMVQYVLDAIRGLGIGNVSVVIGHGGDAVRETLGAGVAYVTQGEPLGTGHALLQAKAILDGAAENLLVVNGDVPLISTESLQALVSRHGSSKAVVTLATCTSGDPRGLGRVIRHPQGHVLGVVEEELATPEERAITETNGGVYCFNAPWLWPNLARLTPGGNGEYLLPEVVSYAVSQGERVEAMEIQNPLETLGINDRIQLAQAEAEVMQRTRERLMLSGVTLSHPPSIFIDAAVEIGPDTVIYPNTIIRGSTRIGSDCHIGPNSIVIDSVVGSGCRILASVIEGAVLEDGVEMGPFSHLRPEAYIGEGTHIGNYVEVKKSRLGRDVKVGHFSYIGDATLGDNVNIGAGTVTCNFDGVDKLPTIIGNDAFIGCDTMLVAPVRVGDRSVTGAGSVVTKDVPADTLVMGVPARIKAKEEPPPEGAP